jgi:hypothetical protein
VYQIDGEATNVRKVAPVNWGQRIVVVLFTLQKVSRRGILPIRKVGKIVRPRIQEIGKDAKVA